jgi:hypothetical protein
VASNSFTELSFVPSTSSSQITIDNVGNMWYFDNATRELGIIDINTGIVTDANVVPVFISDMGRSWCPPASNLPPSIYFPELVMYSDLSQNYPNPFKDRTVIDYYLNQDEKVVLNIYSIEGSLIKRTALDGKAGLNAYTLKVDWNPGTYIYQLKTSSGRIAGRMIKMD